MKGAIVDAKAAERGAAIIGKFNECATLFSVACDQKDADLAQQAAMSGLWAIGGLFPVENSAAHDLLLSMIGVILAARWGRTEHVLLQPIPTIEGTRKGFGHAYVAAFGIAAVRILERQGMSGRAAHREVALLLGDHGYSVSNGDHDQPRPISSRAVRGWCERGQAVHETIAAELVRIHSGKLKEQGAVATEAVIEYLRREAAQVVRRSKML